MPKHVRSHNPTNTTLRGWLYAVAANVVSDHLRRRYRASHVELDEAIPSHEAGPAELAEATLAREDLKLASDRNAGAQQHAKLSAHSFAAAAGDATAGSRATTAGNRQPCANARADRFAQAAGD